MKALILAAGYGTRNLPATKTIPKELLPLYDKTIIDFILGECREAGISELIILTNRRKKTFEDYFDRDPELELFLKKNKKQNQLNIIKHPCDFCVTFIRQHKMLGTGHALLSAKHLLKDAPFAVFFPDDIILSSSDGIKQLIEIHKKTNCSVLGAREEYEDPSLYGVIEYKQDQGLNYVTNIVEKPKKGTMNSNLVSIGRFIYTPEFLDILEQEYLSHTTGEFYPMGGIIKLAQQKKILVHPLKGKILDTGNHQAYFKACLEYADQTLDGKEIIDNFIKHRKSKPL